MGKAVMESVLRLAPAERMRLLDAICASLERPDASMDEIWLDEAERRLASYKAGKAREVPAESVIGRRP